jgi:hypothetical protein
MRSASSALRKKRPAFSSGQFGSRPSQGKPATAREFNYAGRSKFRSKTGCNNSPSPAGLNSYLRIEFMGSIRRMAKASERYRAPSQPTGPIPTLADLRQRQCWVWINCAQEMTCRHRAAVPLAVPIIRWGGKASSNVLRQRVRCTSCGGKGATITLPSWIGGEVGPAPFRGIRA